MTTRHMIEGAALIFVTWCVAWSYGMQRGWKDGYTAGKDVAQRMMENQDRMVSHLNKLSVIKGGNK